MRVRRHDRMAVNKCYKTKVKRDNTMAVGKCSKIGD